MHSRKILIVFVVGVLDALEGRQEGETYIENYTKEYVLPSARFGRSLHSIPSTSYIQYLHEKKAPIGAWKCNFPPFYEFITCRPTDRPTKQPTDGQTYSKIFLACSVIFSYNI